MKKTIIAVIGVLVSMCLIIGIFAGCNAAKDSKESAQTVSTDGSTSMEKVIGYLSESYMADNKNVTVTYNPTGSGAGIQASLALGAAKTETVFKVTLPAAKSGIVTAVVLGIGRAIGEAMAVMMVAGNVANMPSLFKSVRFLTTAVASEMSYSSGLQRQALFSIALILFIFIMAINIILNLTVKKNKE